MCLVYKPASGVLLWPTGTEQDVWAPPFGRRRLGAGVWAPPFGRTAVWAPDVWAPALMREEIGSLFHQSRLNLVMKITRASLQSKLDGLISMLTRILR